MKVYLVGGAVRDGLLGLPVAEHDWVVVGADAATLRAQGFEPVDRDFPVFRHPETGEEYALARRETKRGEGYRGFAIDAGPDVTLEEDLRRRDLTINAMAQDGDGQIVDPFGGRDDLNAGLLRHVSPAFVEDPLRVLRVARFAARLGRHGFRVAHSTHRLMRQMVEHGDMAHLTRERLWREMHRAMQDDQPWRFFEVLHACGALAALMPALAARMGEEKAHRDAADPPPIAMLKRVARLTDQPAARLATVLAAGAASVEEADALLDALRADRATALLLRRVVAARTLCKAAGQGDVDALYTLATRWRAFDDTADLDPLVQVCTALEAESRLPQMLQVALPAARAVATADLRRQGLSGAELGRRLDEARRASMQSALLNAGLIP